MIEQWFLQEIEYRIKTRKRLVVLDPNRAFGFLIPQLEQKGYLVIPTDPLLEEHWQTVKEELFLRTKAESDHKEDLVVFYITRSQSKLTFLFDYCFTHGCVDLSSPAEWLRSKIKQSMDIATQLDARTLLIAGKLSIGKDLTWWKMVLLDPTKIMDWDHELVEFLTDPEAYIGKQDPDVRKWIEEQLFDLLEQTNIPKPATTLATEIMNLIFARLLNNNLSGPLQKVYVQCVDSTAFQSKMSDYIQQFKVPEIANLWKVDTNHCFSSLDELALHDFISHLSDKDWVKEKLGFIKKRSKCKDKNQFIPTWWDDIGLLMEYKSDMLKKCQSLKDVATFYTTHFSPVDRAIRHLYASFLNDPKIMRPLQEYYESLQHELLQSWFQYAKEYQADQPGYLTRLLSSTKKPIAVIVGDGVRYEIADFIACQLEKQFQVEKQIMLAGIPSETEHNMSALYVGSDELIPLQSDREKRLKQTLPAPITFLSLEKVNKSHVGLQSVVLTYKDIDQLGESMELGTSIKLFAELEKLLKDKIAQLLQLGFAEVHLVTDHGFVLTGLLTDADKIDGNATGKKEVHERFIRTVDKQDRADWIEFERPKGEFRYVYVAKNHRPFKTPGVYGYSHGGFTPQEVILPNFVFSKKTSFMPSLKIEIKNKNDLKEITGENFSIQLKGKDTTNSLFPLERTVYLILYSGTQEISRSSMIKVIPGKEETINFSFQGHAELKAVLLDTGTNEQLDSFPIKKSKARDFGGLI